MSVEGTVTGTSLVRLPSVTFAVTVTKVYNKFYKTAITKSNCTLGLTGRLYRFVQELDQCVD